MSLYTALAYKLADIDGASLNVPKTNFSSNGAGSSTQTILQIVFGMGGGAALIIIIVSGLRFVTSQGDPDKTNKARNSIIYAIVGLVVCVLAFSIVTFVLGHIG